MRLFDAHCHLNDAKFDFDREETIKNCHESGVEKMVCASDTLEDSALAVEIAEAHQNIYAAIGIHPHNATTLDEEALFTLELLAKKKSVKAIGEIGLDYYRDLSPRDVQRNAFIQQIELAKKLKLPIVIHDRDANGDVFDILREHDAFVNGLQMHSYSGSAELARQYVKLGAYISLSGPVTYKNAPVKREVAKVIPIERLLIETDSPYLTPQAKRGMRNEPSYVYYVAEKIAEVKGISVEEVAETTYQNACQFFGV